MRWERWASAVTAACVLGMAVGVASAAAGRLVPSSWSLPAWNPAEYDGFAATTDAADLTSLPTVHAVYVYPSDAQSRFGRLAAKIQRDARQASWLLEASFGRGIRWDERLGTGANAGTRYLDISVAKSKYTTKRLGSSQQFSLVRQELSARGFTNANKKYVVWLDAPSTLCGQSDAPTDSQRTASNAAERRTVSAIYRYYDPSNAEGGFCSPVLHELAHAMGAVNPWAPHYDAGHCNDNGNDVLCKMASTIPYDPSLDGFYVDYGNDDYWDPAADPFASSSVSLRWWTINLSRFICPSAPGTVNPNTGAPHADCAQPNANPGY
jgi:hypothetical protein